MKDRRTILAWIVGVWLAVTASAAVFYVSVHLGPPSEGYEAEWDWQLMFFALTRLPWFLLILGVVLGLAWWFTREAEDPNA